MEFRPPIRLTGRFVELLPLSVEHVPGLARAANDPGIWTYWRSAPLLGEERIRAYVTDLLARQVEGTVLAFTLLARGEGAPAGVTRFFDIQRPNGSVEIGTWLERRWWKTPFNTESKRLMLAHAFETEGCHRVQLQTDVRNLPSLRAVERLGAVREGTLRECAVNFDGHRRSSAIFSILAPEWPAVRTRLDAHLARPWPPTASGGRP
ncbi:MAG: GNAT family N-acetyltransferase [Thermoplasmata archaeon]